MSGCHQGLSLLESIKECGQQMVLISPRVSVSAFLFVWLAVSISVGGFHELPTNVSEFPWVELEGAQLSVEVEVSEVEAAAAGLLHFLLLSLARNKAL